MAQSVINEKKLRAMFIGLSTVFNNELQASSLEYQQSCMIIQSAGRGMDYAWLSRFPKMREWTGDKTVKNLELGTYYIANKDWESTIAVNRNDIEDDQLQIYMPQAQMMGRSASELNGMIANDLKNAAFTKQGMDGVYFYSASHPVRNSDGTTSTYSNLGSAALSAATAAAANASLGVARIAIMKMTDSEGVNLGLMPDTLEVPPALEATARILATSTYLYDDTPNPYNGTVKVLVNPGITKDDMWMLHVTTMPVKPFIIQLRSAPKFVSQTSLDNDAVFNKREYKFGVEARGAGAYGFSQLSYGYPGA